MKIQNSSLNDVDAIFKLYKIATDFQKIKFSGNVWPEFDRELITTEIKENRQFKITIDNKIACIWAITFSDEQIWQERNKQASIYIHRIATNPDFRGQNFVLKIVAWSKVYAASINKEFIRMDTCGNNVRLINHYIACGFEFLGLKRPNNTSELPSHYDNAEVCFFEIKLRKH